MRDSRFLPAAGEPRACLTGRSESDAVTPQVSDAAFDTSIDRQSILAAGSPDKDERMAPRINPEAKQHDRPAEFEFERPAAWSEEDEWDTGLVSAVLYTQPWWRNAPRLTATQAAS